MVSFWNSRFPSFPTRMSHQGCESGEGRRGKEVIELRRQRWGIKTGGKGEGGKGKKRGGIEEEEEERKEEKN